MIHGRLIHDPKRHVDLFRFEDGTDVFAFSRPDFTGKGLPDREFVLIPLDELPEVIEEGENFAIIHPVTDEQRAEGRVPTDPRGWVHTEPKRSPWVHRQEHVIREQVAFFLAREAWEAREARKAEHEATLAVIRAATLPDELPPVDDVVSALRSLGYNVSAGPWNG